MIKNLSLQLNEAGKIKIGIKGKEVTSEKGKSFRMPKKLDHFQLTTTEKNADGDYIVDVDLQNRIKESGAGIMNADGCLTGIPIRLLYDDTELNFPTQYVSYVSGQLSCSGDGEVSRKRIDDYQVEHPCPCPRVESGYDGKDKCKPTGVLTCVIDEAGLFGQAHKFRTTSMNSIKGILGGIELIKTATNGRIAGLPLMLTLNSKQTVTPGGPSTIYIVSICYRGNLADLKAEALRIMGEEKQYLIAMDSIEQAARVNDRLSIVSGTDDEREFVEEFFPHAAVAEEKPTEEKKIEEKTIDPDPADVNENHSESTEPADLDLPILPPVGQYKKIYDQFIEETDIDKAMSFANRLQKGNLFYYLEQLHPTVSVNPKMLKPDLLDFIKNLLEADALPFDPDQEDQQQEQEQPQDKEQGSPASENTEEPESTTAPPVQGVIGDDGQKYIRSWDNSGPITKDQLRRLVQLKTTLEKQGVLRPDKWTEHVQFFVDQAGEKISTAVKLTTEQGDTFIRMLEANLTDESVAA